MSLMEKLFKLRENNTTPAAEVRAGIVTFLTLSYIIFVQPAVLAQTGISHNTVFVATCVSSAIACLLMAFLANYPIALAPAMGHNFLFVSLVLTGAVNWQTALGATIISGIAFIILSCWGFREQLINAVPHSLKHGIAVGIGLLIAFVGFQWSGIAVRDVGQFVTLGNLHSTPVLLAIGGLALTATLIALRIRGAILIGILITAIAGIPLGITSTASLSNGPLSLPVEKPMPKLLVMPLQVGKHIESTNIRQFQLQTGRALQDYYSGEAVRLSDADIKEDETPADVAKRLGAGVVLIQAVERKDNVVVLTSVAYQNFGKESLQLWREYNAIPLTAEPKHIEKYADDVVLGLPGHHGIWRFDVLGALKLGIVHVIFVFFFLDLFDSIGTLIGVAQQAGFLRGGKLPRARGALLSDAIGTVIGAAMGTSTVSSYIESSAGVAEGGRTGLANIVTAGLLLLALFFSPVVQMIGGDYNGLHPALAPVLIIIGSIMLGNVTQILWNDPTEAIPAFLAIMIMPLTMSITDGIAFGFISYTFLKLITGKHSQVHWLLYVFSLLFLARYSYL